MKDKRTVIVGVTSGIAAYKTLDLVRLLKKDGAEVFVVMTKNAMEMVSVSKFRKASGNKVYSKLFEKGFDYTDILKIRRVDHIDLADKADIVVIAPATANCIAKISHGIADDFLTTMLLATEAPIIVCPSMNVHMWENNIVSDNVRRLRSFGFLIVEPEVGQLACGYQGKGRLAHIEHIKGEIYKVLKKREQFKGKKILVTAGAAIEKIDDVRFITNKSSGKMGIAIANECFYRGADVLLLRAKSSIKSSIAIPEVTFETADELEKLINKNIRFFDTIYHTAAVSDFQTQNIKKGKISSKESLALRLKPAKKIINGIKKRNPKIKVIAFKAQWGLNKRNVLPIAQDKFKDSNADAVVINDVSKKDRGFGADTNEVFVVTRKGSMKKIPLAKKQDIATSIIDFLVIENIF